ncbi:DUF6588 family protein [Catalinimonas niigatensis]|uniref:DUF6588 family protein n=1 Tax=Catalinimonas niigatensis TaxID=1397264 RepID=UPI00266556B4|nr:DUF6588 family protein [Catalinimonas niigatensis]WPP48428.1 DUF6588 family protein [Catalinimonas niigatensis]
MIKYVRKSLSLFCVIAGTFSSGFAQSDVADFIKGGVQDAEKLFNAYAAPFGESFGANLNAGWINTAAPLKPGRFELKLVANVAFVPTNKKTYNLDALGFRNPVMRTINGETAVEQWQYENAIAPTIFGSGDDAGSIIKTLTYQDPITGEMVAEEVAELPLPSGIGIGFNPIAPAPQLSVGLPFGTEIMGRYLPGINTTSDETSIDFRGIWGIGFKHDIKQWIPGIKSLPFSLSMAFGYSSSQAELAFAPVLPEAPSGEQFADPDLAGTAYTGPAIDNVDYNEQGIAFKASAWNLNLLASKKVSVLSVYGGLRYSRAKTNVTLQGIYGVAGEPYFNQDNVNDPNNGRYTLINTDKDPIQLDMPLSQVALIGGFRLKLAFFSMFAEGNYSKYSTVSAGIGFGWMN